MWSSTRASQGHQIPEELLDTESSSKPHLPKEPRIVSPYAPVLAPIAALSRLSLSLKRTASTRSIPLEPNARISYPGTIQQLNTPAVPRSQSSTPSLTRTYTAASSKSRSSNASLGLASIKQQPTNLIPVDQRGNMGCILDNPDPSRIVIFLPSPPPTQGQAGPATSGSLLVINSPSSQKNPSDHHQH